MLAEQKSKGLQDIFSSLIKEGDLEGLQRIIAHLERHKSWVGDEGFSPLHVAAKYNQVEICYFLLEQGITPDVTEPFTSKAPLHIAAYFGHLEVIKVLRNFGASLNLKDSLFSMPIHYAAMGQHKEIILFFLENRISGAAQSEFGNILDILVRKKNFDLIDFFTNICGSTCLDLYCLPTDRPRRGLEENWTAFHFSAISGQEKVFEMLLQKFPHLWEIQKKIHGDPELTDLCISDLIVLEGSSSIKKRLGIEKNTDEYRKTFLKENSYEVDFPEKKEICDAIRYRDTRKLKNIIAKKGEQVLFEKKGRTKVEKWLGSELKCPNALDLANWLYSLPFFDYLIENKIQIPNEEFFLFDTLRLLFFNWALMEVHPKGERFLRKIGEETRLE